MGEFKEAMIDRGADNPSDEESKTIIEIDWEHDSIPTEIDEQALAQAVESLKHVETARFRK